MERQKGFTVFELIVAIVFLLVAGTFFYIQKRNIDVAANDSARKVAINSIYYNLEEVYYAANGAYPEYLTADQLTGLDPELLTDPNGIKVNQEGSDYTYTPKDCTDGKCKSYTLTANLENESDHTKTSRNE